MLTEEQIYKTVYYQFAKHGLLEKGWDCQIDCRLKAGWACTKISKRKILFSPACCCLTNSQFRTLVYHEIAHALLPKGVTHGKRWKKLCLKLGGTGAEYFLRRKQFQKFLVKSS